MKKQLTKFALTAALGLAITLTFTACEEKQAAKEAGGDTFTDSRDGKKYKTVKIGTLTWLAENLNYAAEGSKCYGEGDRTYDSEKKDYVTLSAEEIQANCEKYGRLYNWEQAMKACPSGWLLPDDDIWETLVDLAGSDGKLKAKNGWKESYDGKDLNGTDIYGFSALPSGYYNSYQSIFNDVGSQCLWWSSTDLNDQNSYAWGFRTYQNDVSSDVNDKIGGISVRCVLEDAAYLNAKTEAAKKAKEKAAEGACPNAVTDNNAVSCGGQTYKTVKIGKQVWMAENLNYEAKDGGSWCYNDSTSYCDKYGRLYKWETAMTVCPKGWHLPTNAEWQSLIDLAGGSDTFGFSAGGIFFPECVSNGEDCSYEHVYGGAGDIGWWWTSTKKYARYNGMRVEDGFNANTGGNGENDRFSVRCLQD